MKKEILLVVSIFFSIIFSSCGGGEKKLDEKEQKAVETQVLNDQKSMDSLEKAIKAQIDAVDEDSLMKVEH
ncbi:MAG: hypothetical protein WCO54_09790 [Bacteroidota bacterium]